MRHDSAIEIERLVCPKRHGVWDVPILRNRL
jgi:hypothetical protein